MSVIVNVASNTPSIGGTHDFQKDLFSWLDRSVLQVHALRMGKRYPFVMTRLAVFQGTITRGESQRIYDDSRPFGEVDANADLVSRFIYTGSRSIPTYMIRNGKTYLFVNDLNGSVGMLVDIATGQIIQRLDYSPIGKVKSDTNPGFQPFGYKVNFAFSERESPLWDASGLYDQDTGLMRMGSRDYDPESGRWLARDPLSFGGGDLNLFIYCANDGISHFDPDGHLPILIIFAGGVLAFGYIAVQVETFRQRWNPQVQRNNRRATIVGMDLRIGRADAENAIRHCVGQCEFKRIDAFVAASTGYWHESRLIPRELRGGGMSNLPFGDTYRDGLKDGYNNSCGRENAEKSQACLESCSQDLASGKLATDLNGSFLFPYTWRYGGN